MRSGDQNSPTRRDAPGNRCIYLNIARERLPMPNGSVLAFEPADDFIELVRVAVVDVHSAPPLRDDQW